MGSAARSAEGPIELTRRILFNTRVGEGVFRTDVAASVVRAVIDAVDAKWPKWPKSEQQCRVYHADGLVYETDGADSQRVTSERLVASEEDDEGRVLQLTFEVQKQPFHAFPSDISSLRAVADVSRVTYKVTNRVSLVLELSRVVRSECPGPAAEETCRKVFIALLDGWNDSAKAVKEAEELEALIASLRQRA